jgi:hypothetical protein
MLSLGDQVTLENGGKDSIYKAVQDCIGASSYPCNLVVLPILEQVNAGATGSIKGFACMKLLSAERGKDAHIKAQMSNECPPPPSGGIGPNYGVISPPSLFK